MDFESLSAKSGGEESSAAIKARVDEARRIQLERFRGSATTCNAKMTPAQTQEFCEPEPEAKALIKNAFEKLGLSARAYDKILKLSRTVADLAGEETIRAPHVLEAIRYRNLDRRLYTDPYGSDQ